MQANEIKLSAKMTEKELDVLKVASSSKFKKLETAAPKLFKKHQELNNLEESYEIFQIQSSMKQLLDNHFVNEYIKLFNKFIKYYELNINLKKVEVEKMMQISQYLPAYAQNKLQSIVSTNKDVFDKFKFAVKDDTDTSSYAVRISDTLYDWLTMSYSSKYSSCTNWGKVGVGANTPFLYYLSPYCKVVKFYHSVEEAELNINPIGRIVISQMPSGNVFFHRVYAQDKAKITQACSLLASNVFGEELIEASISIRCQKGPRSYPDLMLALGSCLNKHIIVNKEELANDKLLLADTYNKGRYSLY